LRYLDSRRSTRIRVLVVEDHRILAEALVALLHQRHDFEVLGWVATVKEAIARTDQGHPHVVLMDSHLPDGTGAEAAASIHRRHPEIAIVFLSVDDSYDAMLAAMEAGARGYLSKAVAASELEAAVCGAADGDMLLSAELLATLLNHQQDRRVRPVEATHRTGELTSREQQVLELLAAGLNNRDIARQLGVTYGTVRTHVRNLLAKIGVHSRLEAVARAGENGLLAVPLRSLHPMSSLN
jgi:two-component system, NarL family, nitrate/nitrite response regulator NarL